MRPIWLVFLPALAYQCLSLFASLRQTSRKRKRTSFQPGVSVLKPLRGLDPGMAAAFASQVQQDYPEFELLFGVQSPDDPAIEEVRRLQREYPSAQIRLIVGGVGGAANRKVGVLIELAKQARYPVWVVNDSDIKVTPGYLSEVVAPLEQPSVGVVTCLYRPIAYSLATTWEALGVATDFMPSTLVAPLLGVREFGLGSTLAFRAADLEQAGGFGPIGIYLADDYQLAKRITALGKRSLLSTYVVETSLGDTNWPGVWQHQLRWGRTIRMTKGAGYAGLPVTHAGLWALLALFTGNWPVAVVLLALRVAAGLSAGWLVLRSRVALRLFLLIPLWDLFAFAVWVASYCGTTVRWRDRALRVNERGEIVR